MPPRIPSSEVPRIAQDDWDAYSYYVLNTLADLKSSHATININLTAVSERIGNMNTSLTVLNYKVFVAGSVVGSIASALVVWAINHFGK